jgi:hypothetical protein
MLRTMPTSPKKPAAPKANRGPAAARTPPRRVAPRADFGSSADEFFARQPPHLRAILEALRELIEEVAPGAVPTLKWGMPHYTIDGVTPFALGAHKAHVNLILLGPPEAFDDPDGLLSGEGKTGRHLRLTSLDQLPRDAVRGWLRAALEVSRGARKA